MKALVTFALETEFAPWRERRTFRSVEWGAAQLFGTEIDGLEVGVLLTGAGPKLAQLAAAKAMKCDDSIRFCISSGLAGGLRAEHKAGQILAARSISYEEAQPGVLDSSDALVSFASECGAVVVDRFLTTARVVGRADEKKHLGATADAVEMESFGVLAAAQEEGIPAAAIRVIGDTVNEDMPLDMNEILTDEGRVSIPRVLGQVALNPGSIPALVRLGQDTKRSATALCEFLDRYMQRLAAASSILGSKTAAGS